MDHNDLDMLMITETRNIMDEMITGQGRKMTINGRVNKRTRVVVAKLEGTRLIIKAAKDRIIHIEYPLGVNIIGVYRLIELAAKDTKEKFWQDLTAYVHDIKEPLIVIGDFNAGHEEGRCPGVKQEEQKNYKRLVKFANANLMEI